MTDNTNNNQAPDKKTDKDGKPRFNTNWIFAILAVSLIIFSLFNNGKSVQQTTTSEIKGMIANHDIEKIVVINKEVAEIYLKKDALESGRYPKLSKPGTGFGIALPKPNFTYNIGDISSFEPFLLKAQKDANYADKDLIYPDYQTRKNWFGDILSWLLLPVLLIAF
jgi:cell division protease FtsH